MFAVRYHHGFTGKALENEWNYPGVIICTISGGFFFGEVPKKTVC